MSDQLPHDEELRALYRKLPADEPRSEIDDVILAAARRQIHDKHRRRFFRRLGWTVPLAAAASIAVTVTLIGVAPEHPSYPAAARLDDRSMWSARPNASMPQMNAPAARPPLAAAKPAAPEAKQGTNRAIDEAARQKLAGLGYVDKDQGVASNEPAREEKRDDASPSPAAPREPADSTAAGSSGGWRKLGADRSLETVESQLGLSGRASGEAKKKAEAAPGAPAPGTAQPKAAPIPQPKAAAPAAPQPKAAAPESFAAPSREDSLTMNVGPLAKARVAPPPPPPAAEPPPVATASPPVAAEPPPVATASPPVAAEPPPVAAAPAPAPEVAAELHEDRLADDKTGALAVADLERRRAEEADAASGRMQRESATLPGAVPVVPASWPFRLEAGLDEDESCRRVLTTLQVKCEVSRDTATVALKQPKEIESGEFAGAKASRLRLIFKNGKLWKMLLLLEGYKTEQVLVAPPSHVSATPAPSSPAAASDTAPAPGAATPSPGGAIPAPAAPQE